jgi:NAD+ diphosphatase
MALERLALSRSTLDRAAHLRADPELLNRLAADPTTLVLPVLAGQAPGVDGPDGPVLLLSAPIDRPEVASPQLRRLFLGQDDEQRSYLAVALDTVLDPALDTGPDLPEGARWAGLREVGAVLDDTGAGILTAAVALLAWHTNHTRCARCGAETDVIMSGWSRHCPNCGAEHYPRTDPAVIMSVVDAEDRILLGRQASWPPLRFSTLAGFVEPGESLEDAVRREVDEECGITVGEVSYRGSQPWPFPSSLMLGFRGEATDTVITVDEVEIAEARWWTRQELADDVKDGKLRLPPPVSIARRLIEDWFGEPIDGSTGAWG